eukprot:3941911-Rhodomonas_salina.1
MRACVSSPTLPQANRIHITVNISIASENGALGAINGSRPERHGALVGLGRHSKGHLLDLLLELGSARLQSDTGARQRLSATRTARKVWRAGRAATRRDGTTVDGNETRGHKCR